MEPLSALFLPHLPHSVIDTAWVNSHASARRRVEVARNFQARSCRHEQCFWCQNLFDLAAALLKYSFGCFFFFAEVGPFVFHSKTFICRTVTISFSTVPSSLSPNVKAEGTQRLPRSLPSSSASVMEEWVHCFDFDSADGPNRIKWR